MIRIPLFFLLGLCLFLVQCKDDDSDPVPECPDCNFTCLSDNEPGVFTNDCQSNWDCRYEMHENASLKYATGNSVDNATIENGNKRVFQVTLDTEGEANIADDEITELIFFEIDPAQESFSAENEELDLLNLRYQQLCFCADVHLKKPETGCIQGQRIDDSNWRVQMNFGVEYGNWTKEVKVDAVFSL